MNTLEIREKSERNACITAPADYIKSIKKRSWKSTFFSQDILSMLNGKNVKFTASVPFERFTELKDLVEGCKCWKNIDEQWSYFQAQWKSKKWDSPFRFVFIWRKNKKQRKGPLQLKLFEPTDFPHDFNPSRSL